jgi:hypothetical protein
MQILKIRLESGREPYQSTKPIQSTDQRKSYVGSLWKVSGKRLHTVASENPPKEVLKYTVKLPRLPWK